MRRFSLSGIQETFASKTPPHNSDERGRVVAAVAMADLVAGDAGDRHFGAHDPDRAELGRGLEDFDRRLLFQLQRRVSGKSSSHEAD